MYLLRLVLHDWSNKYATLILHALIPALKQGAKVLINDRIVPGHHEVPYLVEREARFVDLYFIHESEMRVHRMSTASRCGILLLHNLPKSTS